MLYLLPLTFAAEPPVTTGNPIIDSLAPFGVIGIVLALAALGYIWFKPGVEALKETIKTLQAINDRLLKNQEEQAVPAIYQAISAMTKMAESLKELRAEFNDQRDEIQRLRAERDTLREQLRQSGK